MESVPFFLLHNLFEDNYKYFFNYKSMTWQNFAVIGNSSIFGDLQDEEINKKNNFRKLERKAYNM